MHHACESRAQRLASSEGWMGAGRSLGLGKQTHCPLQGHAVIGSDFVADDGGKAGPLEGEAQRVWRGSSRAGSGDMGRKHHLISKQ